MAVPANICVAWPSTVASIPSGWTRETSLDSRYILGAASGADTDLITDRGATTHIHTSPSHTPTQDVHIHNFANTSANASSNIVGGGAGGIAVARNHGHADADSDSTIATNNGIAITVDPTPNDLAFTEVIWIKSNGSPTTFPSGCFAFFASDSLPSGWSRVNGNQYLKGAAGGGDGGATGGANTHSHTSPAHTHTQNSHTHTGTSGGAIQTQTVRGNVANLSTSAIPHSHSVTLNATTATNQSVTTTISSSNHEPPFTKLNTVQAASATLPTNIVALWLGTNAAIPTGWLRFTAMDDRWLKGANADGESGVTTGGASQHTHTASDCQPIQNAHNHTVTDGGADNQTVILTSGGSGTWPIPGHTHATGWSVDTTVPTNQSVAVSIDISAVDAALPKHRTVIYVQFTGSTPTPPRATITSYDLNLFDLGSPDAQVLPEVAKKIAQGDLRYVPR